MRPRAYAPRGVGAWPLAQELVEACTMREAAAAQLALLTENPSLYQPAIEAQRQQAAAIAMQMAQQQQ